MRFDVHRRTRERRIPRHSSQCRRRGAEVSHATCRGLVAESRPVNHVDRGTREFAARARRVQKATTLASAPAVSHLSSAEERKVRARIPGSPRRRMKSVPLPVSFSAVRVSGRPGASPATDLGAAGEYRFVIFRGSPSAVVWTPPTSFPASRTAALRGGGVVVARAIHFDGLSRVAFRRRRRRRPTTGGRLSVSSFLPSLSPVEGAPAISRYTEMGIGKVGPTKLRPRLCPCLPLFRSPAGSVTETPRASMW